MNPAERPNEPSSLKNAFLQLVQQHQRALQAGHMEDAEVAACNLLAMMAEHAATQPNAEMLLLSGAASQEAAADWQGTEGTYKKLLEQAIATGEATARYRAHASLSGLYQLLGDYNQAIEQARSATAAARRADLPILLAMALEQQATCALRLELIAEAVSAVEEALRCMTDETRYDLMRGRCLIVQAECGLKSGHEAAAESDLKAAWQLLEMQSTMQFAAGVHATLARYWSVKAGLQDKQGDVAGRTTDHTSCLRLGKETEERTPSTALTNPNLRRSRDSRSRGLHCFDRETPNRARYGLLGHLTMLLRLSTPSCS